MNSPLNFIPVAGTNNRLIIKRDIKKGNAKKIGSLIVMESSKDEILSTGIVLGVSPQDENGKIPFVKVGYRVLFDEYSIKKIQSSSGELLTCRESAVIGVYLEDEKDNSITLDEQLLEDVSKIKEVLTHPDK